MENVLRKQNFLTFVKVCRLLSKVLLVVFGIGLSVVAMLFALVGLISSERLESMISKGTWHVSLNFSGINIGLTDQVVSNFQFSKQPILTLLALTGLYVALLLFITYCVHAILKSIQHNQVFSKATSKYMEWIAYGIIFMSVTLQPIQTMVVFLFDVMFHLSNSMQGSDFIQSVSYNFFQIHWSLLFSGAIMWIVARIFKYGAFLQDEYDATL